MIEEKLKDDDSVMRKLFLILTRMSFSRKLKQQVGERFEQYLPDDSQLNEPNLVYCGESKDNPDALLILDKIISKEPPAAIREALFGDQIEATGEVVKEMFIECILSRARKSLEHLKRFVEIYYVEILQPFFLGENQQVSQLTLMKMIVQIWGEKNQYKTLQIVDKLLSQGLLLSESVLEWAFISLEKIQAKASGDSIEFKLIETVLERADILPNQLATLFN